MSIRPGFHVDVSVGMGGQLVQTGLAEWRPVLSVECVHPRTDVVVADRLGVWNLAYAVQ